MTRCIVNVSTGDFVAGQARLKRLVTDPVLFWTNKFPPGSPSHHEMPFAFKAHALEQARLQGVDLVMWMDACIKPIRSLEPLWTLIEQQGHWFAANWWPNGEWCCDAALPFLGITREESFQQMHVVAGAFGLSLRSGTGSGFLDDYLVCAKNGAFRGPSNNRGNIASLDPRVKGHRHDQTAASVIAHRRGMRLTIPPAWFAYKGSETGETVLVADGTY